MDKRARELARRLGAGEVTTDEVVAEQLRLGAFSDAAIELAALAGGQIALSVADAPTFASVESWLLEFNRWGHGVRVRVCCALATVTLVNWPGQRCECGHASFVHLVHADGCGRCDCLALQPAPSSPAAALRALGAWLENPGPGRAAEARETALACSFSAPTVAVAGFSAGGRSSFPWIEAALCVAPEFDLKGLRREIRRSLGSLPLAQALVVEPAPRVSALPPTPRPRLVFSERDMDDAEAIVTSSLQLPAAEEWGDAAWLHQVPEHREAHACWSSRPGVAWPWIAAREGELVTWREESGRKGSALGLSGSLQLRLLQHVGRAEHVSEAQVRAAGRGLESLFSWIKCRGANRPDFELVLREVLVEGFSWRSLPGWEEAVFVPSLYEPDRLFQHDNLFEDV